MCEAIRWPISSSASPMFRLTIRRWPRITVWRTTSPSATSRMKSAWKNFARRCCITGRCSPTCFTMVVCSRCGRCVVGWRRKAEGGRRKAEGGRQKAEGRRQKAEGGRRKAEGRRQKAEGGRQKAEGRRQKAERDGGWGLAIVYL